MAYERPRPFGFREAPPTSQWRSLLSLVVGVYAALSLFGLSAVWYWEARDQGYKVKTVHRTVREYEPAPKPEKRTVRYVLDKGVVYP